MKLLHEVAACSTRRLAACSMSKVEQEKTDKMLIKSLEREERERKRVRVMLPLLAMPFLYTTPPPLSPPPLRPSHVTPPAYQFPMHAPPQTALLTGNIKLFQTLIL